MMKNTEPQQEEHSGDGRVSERETQVRSWGHNSFLPGRVEKGVGVDFDALTACVVQETGVKPRPGCLEKKSRRDKGGEGKH